MSDLPKINVTGSKHPVIDNDAALKRNKVKQFIGSGARRHSISIQGTLHRFGCTGDDREAPAANPSPSLRRGADNTSGPTTEPRLRGVASPLLSMLRAGWRRVVALNRRIEDSGVGDVLALLSLAAAIYVFLVAGWVLS